MIRYEHLTLSIADFLRPTTKFTVFSMGGSSKVSNIPVIDISTLDQATADHLVHAAIEHGFLYVKASGLEFQAEDIDKTFRIVRAVSK